MKKRFILHSWFTLKKAMQGSNSGIACFLVKNDVRVSVWLNVSDNFMMGDNSPIADGLLISNGLLIRDGLLISDSSNSQQIVSLHTAMRRRE